MAKHSLKTKLDNSVTNKVYNKPTSAQKKYLKLGDKQPGGKLPLFDDNGQRIHERTIQACMRAGWCEPWARNSIEPKWLVCKLTADGKQIINN